MNKRTVSGFLMAALAPPLLIAIPAHAGVAESDLFEWVPLSNISYCYDNGVVAVSVTEGSLVGVSWTEVEQKDGGGNTTDLFEKIEGTLESFSLSLLKPPTYVGIPTATFTLGTFEGGSGCSGSTIDLSDPSFGCIVRAQGDPYDSASTFEFNYPGSDLGATGRFFTVDFELLDQAILEEEEEEEPCAAILACAGSQGEWDGNLDNTEYLFIEEVDSSNNTYLLNDVRYRPLSNSFEVEMTGLAVIDTWLQYGVEVYDACDGDPLTLADTCNNVSLTFSDGDADPSNDPDFELEEVEVIGATNSNLKVNFNKSDGGVGVTVRGSWTLTFTGCTSEDGPTDPSTPPGPNTPPSPGPNGPNPPSFGGSFDYRWAILNDSESLPNTGTSTSVLLMGIGFVMLSAGATIVHRSRRTNHV